MDNGCISEHWTNSSVICCWMSIAARITTKLFTWSTFRLYFEDSAGRVKHYSSAVVAGILSAVAAVVLVEPFEVPNHHLPLCL